MRKILALLLTLFTSVAIADEHPNYLEAFTAAKDNGKKVMVVFSTAGCVPCANLKYDLRNNPEIKYISDDYEYVIVNASKPMTENMKVIYRQSKVSKFPTSVTIDPQTLKYLKKLQGYSKSSFKKVFQNTENLVAKSKPIEAPLYRSKSKPSWNLSGSWVRVYDRADLSNHLKTTHGMDPKLVDSLTINQLFALHDDDHEGIAFEKVEPEYCPPGGQS